MHASEASGSAAYAERWCEAPALPARAPVVRGVLGRRWYSSMVPCTRGPGCGLREQRQAGVITEQEQPVREVWTSTRTGDLAKSDLALLGISRMALTR